MKVDKGKKVAFARPEETSSDEFVNKVTHEIQQLVIGYEKDLAKMVDKGKKVVFARPIQTSTDERKKVMMIEELLRRYVKSKAEMGEALAKYMSEHQEKMAKFPFILSTLTPPTLNSALGAEDPKDGSPVRRTSCWVATRSN